jgi:hypothetical protein
MLANLNTSFVLLLFITAVCTFNPVSALEYSSGGTTVDVTTRILDASNSTEKCVKYMTNAPEKYKTACFTTINTNNGTFIGCKVQFEDQFCDKCDGCKNNEEEIGFTIDCYNYVPAKSTDSSCLVINDANIQEVLVDDTFDATPFNFSMSLVSTDDSDQNQKNGTRSAASGGTMNRWFISTTIAVTCLFAFSVL